MSIISRSGQAYSTSGPQLRSLKGDARITREFATRRIPQWPTNAAILEYDLWLHVQLVGPSCSPARRSPKKSLGRTRTERREGGWGRITGGGDCRLVYSVLDAPSCGMRRQAGVPRPVKSRPSSSNIVRDIIGIVAQELLKDKNINQETFLATPLPRRLNSDRS